jgi:hypothetical protein
MKEKFNNPAFVLLPPATLATLDAYRSIGHALESAIDHESNKQVTFKSGLYSRTLNGDKVDKGISIKFGQKAPRLNGIIAQEHYAELLVEPSATEGLLMWRPSDNYSVVHEISAKSDILELDALREELLLWAQNNPPLQDIIKDVLYEAAAMYDCPQVDVAHNDMDIQP